MFFSGFIRWTKYKKNSNKKKTDKKLKGKFVKREVNRFDRHRYAKMLLKSMLSEKKDP